MNTRRRLPHRLKSCVPASMATRIRTEGFSKEQVAAMGQHMTPYDLQLVLTEGRHDADATGVKLMITGIAGQTVFSLANPTR